MRVDGSSTVGPLTEAAAEDLRADRPGIRVSVGRSGTRRGFERWIERGIDVCDASRPITLEELRRAREAEVEFLELPVAYDGITFVVAHDNKWLSDLSLRDLRRLFLVESEATVRVWRDLRPEWPALPIRLFGPGADSGTFQEFAAVVAPDRGAIRADLVANAEEHVIARVAAEPGSLGFLGCAYYFANRSRLRAVAIDGGNGPITPSRDSIQAGIYAPFSRPLLVYLSRRGMERPAVRVFAEFLVGRARELSADVGYVPLPADVHELVTRRLRQRTTGSLFWGPSDRPRQGTLMELLR